MKVHHKEVPTKYSLLIAKMLCLWVATSYAEMGFDQRYERDYNIFNPATQYQPDNLLNPANSYDPNSAFNPVNRYDPDNPANPVNTHNPNNPFNPVNQSGEYIQPQRALWAVGMEEVRGEHDE